MKGILKHSRILALAIALTFILSAVAPAYVLAQSSVSSNTQDWAWSDGNQSNQNFNPQTQITASNAGSLQIDWLFSIPGAPAQWSAEFAAALFGGVGIATTPIVYQGIVYVVTSYEEIFALDASNGKLVWSLELPVLPNGSAFLGGAGVGGITLGNHFHNSAVALTTNNLEGGPTLWIAATNYHVYAINALLGNIEENFAFLNGTQANHFGIAGNLGTYSQISPALVIDQNRGIMITSASGTSASNSGRGFFRGWNIKVSPPQLIWTTFTSAPQDGSNPNWDVQDVNSMTGAWIFNGTGAVNLKTLPAAQLNQTLYNDWGYVESPTCKALMGGQPAGGVGESWGGPWVLDEHTGVAYVATNNRNPYDSPCTPGPDLWSASILALNVTTGATIWAFSTNPHDSWDWDCSWNQVLANETVAGQNQEVVMKSCKDGYIYQLNANTGALIWYWTPPASDLPRCEYCHIMNPLNQTQMDSAWPAPNQETFVALPGEGGGFENDMAYDPVNNILVAVQHNYPTVMGYQEMNSTNYDTASGTGYATIAGYTPVDNATAYGINAQTGQEIWHYFIPDIGYRGGVTISGGVAYLTLSTGYLVMVNDKTGAVVGNKLIGGPLTILPAIGATTNGTEEMFLPISAPGISFAQEAPPGDLVVLSLPTSVTTTTPPTVTATVTGVGATVTATSVSTSSTGFSSTAFYAVLVLAVIFVIATGFLAARRRKPAS